MKIGSKEQETYTCEDVFEKEVAPKLEEIYEVCLKHKIPMVSAFVVKREIEGEESNETVAVSSLVSVDDARRSKRLALANALLNGNDNIEEILARGILGEEKRFGVAAGRTLEEALERFKEMTGADLPDKQKEELRSAVEGNSDGSKVLH